MTSEPERRFLEQVREDEAHRIILRRELRSLTQRILAPLIGISRGSLRKFLAMSTPDAPTRERIREWCADRPEPDTPPGMVALAILAREFRASKRAWAREQLGEVLAALIAECGDQPPPWIVDELVGESDPGLST